MAVPPLSRDVTDFQFKKLRALQVFDQLGNVTEKSPNLLAVSNKYGLVFVGISKSIRMILTDDIEQLDEDKSLAKITATKYPYQEVVLAEEITDLALSCDSLTLAACVIINQIPHAHMYDVRSFGGKSALIAPFATFRLSSSIGAYLLDFLWNPAMPSIFATCLFDGSVCVYDVSDDTLKTFATLPPETHATAICWSPMGKQLVVGKRDGTLTQHTPNLQVAKTIEAPPINENETAVVSIAWLSSYQFAVVYRVEDKPCLVLINAPKSTTPIFVDFDDICFGSSDERSLRYYMLHIPKMRVLVCSSSNALDVAVLSNSAGDGSIWEQWNLEDSSRAELPLVGKEETYPMGIALNLTAQRGILANSTDAEFVPPKPILHILSTGGILLSYRIFGTDTTTQPPEALPITGSPRQAATQGFGMASNPLAGETDLLPKLSKRPQTSTVMTISKPAYGSLFAVPATTTAHSSLTPVNTIGSSFTSPTVTTGSSFAGPTITTHNSFVAPAATTNAPTAFGSLGTIGSGKPVSSGSITTGTPLFGAVFGKPTSMQLAPSDDANAAFVLTSTTAKDNLTTASSGISAKTGTVGFTTNLAGKRSQFDSSTKSISAPMPTTAKFDGESMPKPRLMKKNPGQTALVSVLLEELAKFDAEVQKSKKRTSFLVESIATEEEEHVKTEIEQLDNFLQEAKSVTRSMNTDIHILRGTILDGFTSLEEGRSLESRSKDKRFLHLLKTRSLDPMSVKRMKDIRPLFFYLEAQLQEVNTALDNLWNDFQRAEKKIAGGFDLPSLELVYRAMTVNHEIAFNLRQSIDQLAADVSHIKSGGHRSFQPLLLGPEKLSDNLSSTARKISSCLQQTSLQKDESGKKSTSLSFNDMHSLSKMLLKVSVDSKASPQTHIPFGTPKTLSKSRQVQLRSILESRPIIHVRPATPFEEFSQLISPNFTVREFLQDRESEENERLSPQPISSVVYQERETVSNTTWAKADATFPVLKPFLFNQPGGAFMTSQSSVTLQPKAATSAGLLKVTDTSVPVLTPVSAAGVMALPTKFGEGSTNIFTLAASASKNVRGGEQSLGLQIGGIPLEIISRDAPPELPTTTAPQNQAKSPILASLLNTAKKQIPASSGNTSVNSSAGSISGFIFSSAGTKLSDSGPMLASGNKVATSTASPLLLANPAASSFPFSTTLASKTPFGALTPLEISQKSIFGGFDASKEVAEKPKLSSAYEDVTPPTSPHAYMAEEGYLVEEPGNVEEEEEEEEEEDEYEGEEEEQEGEEGDREGDYEDQEQWEDEEETTDAAEHIQAKNADFRLKEAVYTPLTKDKSVNEYGKTDAGDTPTPSKEALDLSMLSPILKATSITATAGSTLTAKDTVAPSSFGASTDSLGEPQVSPARTAYTFANDTTTSKVAAGIFQPSTTSDLASVFTKPEDSHSESFNAALPQSLGSPTAATTSFRFALPDGTTSSEVISPAKSQASRFSFTMPTATTATSTLVAPSNPQSLFGSKLSFGSSDSAGATEREQNVTTTSIFGGSKPSGSGAFSFGQPGKSAFGTTITTPSSVFGEASSTFESSQSMVFGQTASNASSVFGQQLPGTPATTTSSSGGGSLFGQGSSLFGGLGAKPNPENVNKNIFGSPTTFGGASQKTSLFGSSATPQDSGVSWTKSAAGGPSAGGFTGSGFSSPSGSVSQSGFGFQQPKPGTFGSNTGFGSPPTFGGAPTFGSSNQFGSRLFSTSAAQPTGFGSFATAAASDVPTFGSLASQSPGMTFNSISSQKPAQFVASPSPNPPAFGAAPSFASPAFGAPAQINTSPFGSPPPTQPTAFGSPSVFGAQPQQNLQGSPSFSQWR